MRTANVSKILLMLADMMEFEGKNAAAEFLRRCSEQILRCAWDERFPRGDDD